RERNRTRPGRIQVTTHRPRPFVVMGVGRQTALGELDAPAIKEFAAGPDSDKHRRITVLDHADGRGALRSSFRQAFPPLGIEFRFHDPVELIPGETFKPGSVTAPLELNEPEIFHQERKRLLHSRSGMRIVVAMNGDYRTLNIFYDF